MLIKGKIWHVLKGFANKLLMRKDSKSTLFALLVVMSFRGWCIVGKKKTRPYLLLVKGIHWALEQEL